MISVNDDVIALIILLILVFVILIFCFITSSCIYKNCKKVCKNTYEEIL